MGARVVGRCVTKKLRYPTEVEAMIALASVRYKAEQRERHNRPARDVIEVRWYECGACHGGYHLTHLSEEEYAAAEAERLRKRQEARDATG